MLKTGLEFNRVRTVNELYYEMCKASRQVEETIFNNGEVTPAMIAFQIASAAYQNAAHEEMERK